MQVPADSQRVPSSRPPQRVGPGAFLARRLFVLNKSDDLQAWRNHLLNGLCAVAFFMGLLIVVPSIIGSMQMQHWALIAADIAALSCVGLLYLCRGLYFHLRAFAFLLICYLLAVVQLFSIGPLTQPYLLAVPVMCTVLLGSRAAIAALLWCSATLFLAGYVGGIELGLRKLDVSLLMHWTLVALNFLLVAAVLVASCSYLLHGLDAALARQRAVHEALESQIAILQAREAELQASEARYSALFDQVPEAIILSRLADDRVLEVNRGFEEASGWPKDCVIGRSARSLRLLDRAARSQLHVLAQYGSGHANGIESAFRRRDGSLRQGILSTSVILFDGELCALTVVQDVTGERRRELALRESHAARKAAEISNEQKTEFLAMISHEVRTPLGGVIGMLQLAKKDASLSPETRNKLRISLGNAEVLLHIINDILDFSRLEAGKMPFESIDFDLPVLLQDVVALLSDRAETKGISLVADLDPALPQWWRGDPLRLRQVVMNLVGNGVKFTERGEVRLTAGPAPQGGVLLAVSDTGIGIEQEAIGRLFRKFEQASAATSRKYGGAGLGLAICKNIVDAMGGRIEVRSARGIGSVFEVRVPLQAGQPAAAQVAARRMPHTVRLDILCAEDGSTNQIILRELLGDMGHAVTIAEDGAAALALLAQREFDLVIMDSRMPRMDGIAALRLLRGGAMGVRQPGVPVIALTANAAEEERQRFMDAGANGFLPKPIDEASLHAEVGRQADLLLLRAPARMELDAMFGMLDGPAQALRPGVASAAARAAFQREGPRLLGLIRDGIAGADAATVSLHAHSLQGSAGYFGAAELAALCGRIEALADAGLLASVAQLAPSLDSALAAVLAELAAA